MSGSIRRRGAGWEWRTRGPDGRAVSKGGYRTRKAAAEALAKVVTAMSSGVYVEPSRLTVASYLTDMWLPAIKSAVAPSTHKSYETHVRRHICPRIGTVPLQKLTAAQINALYRELAVSGYAKGEQAGEKGVSANTVRRVHATLRRALNDAVIEWRLLARNVAAGGSVKLPKVGRGRMQVWSASELQAFLSFAQHDRLYPLWRFLAMTGIRRGEALGLTWADMALNTRVVSITQARTSRGTSSTKTERSRRALDLDVETVSVVKEWRKVQLEDRMQWGELWTDTGLVFVREDGKPCHPDTITAVFERLQSAYNAAETEAAKKEGRQPARLPRLRLHDLRHTHATLLLANGENPKVVSERLGHSSVGFTLTVYAHVLPGLQKEAVSRLAALVDG